MQIMVDCWYLSADQYYQHLDMGGQPGDLINLDGGYTEQARTMLDDGRGHLFLTGPSKALGQPNGWYSDRFSLCRVVAANGLSDTDFGDDSWFHASPNAPEQSGAEALAMQMDGKLLVAGFVNTGQPGNLSDIAVVRLLGGLPLEITSPGTKDQMEMVVYPNPCATWVNVRAGEGVFTYSVVGMDGKVLRQGQANGEIQLDLTGIAAGVYLLQAQGKAGHSSMRLLVR
jgi:hypothetical protein